MVKLVVAEPSPRRLASFAEFNAAIKIVPPTTAGENVAHGGPSLPALRVAFP